MNFKPLPDQITLKQMVYYKDGSLYWKEGFQIGGARKPHNKLGTLLNTGYLAAYVNGKPYQVHRLVWCYFYGDLSIQIDHINGNRLDNKIENLRPATQQQNQWNKKSSIAKTGFRGVYYINKGNKRFWSMLVLPEGKRKSLGVFQIAEEASLVYEQELKTTRGEWCRK